MNECFHNIFRWNYSLPDETVKVHEFANQHSFRKRMITPEQLSRDLDWLITCPSILDSPLTLDTTANPDRTVGAADFAPVFQFLKSPASYRVGYYVESLMEVWLKKSPQCSDFQHALQINGSERTLGELDFLYRLDHMMNHLEVTLKFYLYDSDDNGSGSHFAGPNARDTFEKKRDRLLNFQIPMGRKHFPEIGVSQVMMKGIIFYPPEADRPDTLPEAMNPNHRQGIWIRESDCDWLSGGSGFSCGTMLKKPFWLSGVFPDSDQQVQPIDELRVAVGKHFQHKRHPISVSVGDASGRETERVFVVSDSWPNQERIER